MNTKNSTAADLDTNEAHENMQHEEENAVDAEIIEELPEDETSSKPKHTLLKQRLLARDQWLRFVFMILFVVIAILAVYVTAVVIVFQFFWNLVTGTSNEHILRLSRGLNQLIHEIFDYLSYTTETKPFPFSDWPEN